MRCADKLQVCTILVYTLPNGCNLNKGKGGLALRSISSSSGLHRPRFCTTAAGRTPPLALLPPAASVPAAAPAAAAAAAAAAGAPAVSTPAARCCRRRQMCISWSPFQPVPKDSATSCGAGQFHVQGLRNCWKLRWVSAVLWELQAQLLRAKVEWHTRGASQRAAGRCHQPSTPRRFSPHPHPHPPPSQIH